MSDELFMFIKEGAHTHSLEREDITDRLRDLCDDIDNGKVKEVHYTTAVTYTDGTVAVTHSNGYDHNQFKEPVSHHTFKDLSVGQTNRVMEAMTCEMSPKFYSDDSGFGFLTMDSLDFRYDTEDEDE